jgi:hypothetical protein
MKRVECHRSPFEWSFESTSVQIRSSPAAACRTGSRNYSPSNFISLMRNSSLNAAFRGPGATARRKTMLIKRALLIAGAATLLIAPAMAAGDNPSSSSPGQMMHKYGSHGQPGASYWAHHKRSHGQTSGSRETKTETTTVHATTGATRQTVQSGKTSTRTKHSSQ